MTRRRDITTDGKTWCKHHACLEPVEDFDWTTSGNGNGSVAVRIPKVNCRLAEQTIRDHGKESDPALYAIEGRAKELAGELSRALGNTVGYSFVLIELNWRALIPIMRALLGPDGLCLNCARHRPTTRELHIEHRIPPLRVADWAAQHARNLWISCAGCNTAKGRNDADRDWIEREQRKWMLDRKWAERAGSKGWPAWDPVFGTPPAASLKLMTFVEPFQLTIDEMLA